MVLGAGLWILFGALVGAKSLSKSTPQPRLEEFYCDRDLPISDELHTAKFIRLRGTTVPNNTGAVTIEEFYSKAVGRLREKLPFLKFASIFAEYTYSANDATDGSELAEELAYSRRWLNAITSAFAERDIRIVELELYAQYGFEENVPFRDLVQRVFSNDVNGNSETPNTDFCKLSFSCDVRFTLNSGTRVLFSGELSSHVSRGPSGRKSAAKRKLYLPESCDISVSTSEDEEAAHHLEAYAEGYSLEGVNLLSKRTVYMDLKVPRDERIRPEPLYETAVSNLVSKLPNMKFVVLRAQTYYTPADPNDESELKSQLRYFKRWALAVNTAFSAHGVRVVRFDLVGTLGFSTKLDLAAAFEETFADDRSRAVIDDPYGGMGPTKTEDAAGTVENIINRNLYLVRIPLGDGVRLEAELLMSGVPEAALRRHGAARKWRPVSFTLKQLFSG